MKKSKPIIGMLFSVTIFYSCNTSVNKPIVEESSYEQGTVQKDSLAYLGQKRPSTTPEMFAPGIISKSDRHEFGCTFSRDGREMFFGVDNDGTMEIHHTHVENEVWRPQKKLFPNDSFSYNDPMLTLDEQRLFFISKRPTEPSENKEDTDIWYIEREHSGWSDPRNLGPTINNDLDQYYSSFTEDGSLYFASKDTAFDAPRYAFDIYRSELKHGHYGTPKKLPKEINTNRYEADVFVAPDESYLIFCSIRRDGLGRGDLYISFKDILGNWAPAVSMGETINTAQHELCPYVTPDGQYLFYTSNQDIYWVSAEIIDDYRE